MARSSQRNVRRAGAGGRQAIVRAYNRRRWYEMADWLVEFTADYLGWVVLAIVVLLLPVAILGAVIGINSLPIEYLGIPALDRLASGNSSFGIAALVLLVEFALLAVSVRPLFKRHIRGLRLVVLAAGIHLVGSLVLQHAVSAVLEFALVVYIYWQVHQEYNERPY